MSLDRKKPGTPARRDGGNRRFRVTKLEERIAPKGAKNGWDNPNNPHYTGACYTAGYCTIY